MKFLLVLIAWCLLFAVCWPLALLLLVALPVIWLVALPFRIGFALVEGVLSLIRALFLLPSRLLGQKGT